MTEPATQSAVLEEVFNRAIEEGDRTAVRARSALGLLVLARIVWEHHALLFAGETKYVATVGILLASLALPPLVKLFARPVHLRATLSVFADALVVTVALLPMIFWPHPAYHGCLRQMDMAFYCLTIAGAGLRMSRRAVAAGMVFNAVAFSVVLATDRALNASLITYRASDVVLFAIILAGSALLALLISARTRTLVFEASRASAFAERARQRLGVFVSQEVAAQVMGTGRLELGGSRRDVAVLFTDLRDFTRYSESLAPERLVHELNAYFEAMGVEIRKQHGLIDKYIGDSIMAVFGLFEPPGDAAARAVRAAAGMQATLAAHNAARAAKGQPPLAHGIGVHYGSVVAGMIGTAEHMQHTVIGDVVNLASRLESASKDLGTPVVISGEAAAAAGPGAPPLKPCGRIEIRGRVAPVDVFTLAEAGAGKAPAPGVQGAAPSV